MSSILGGIKMKTLEQAIEEITYRTEKFPKEALEVIIANKDEAIPYLRAAVEKAIEEKEDLDEEYQLHFPAIFLLAEFQDKEFFPKMIELASLPDDALDWLIGDVITEDLCNILYNVFNGDIEIMKQAIWNRSAGDFSRGAIMHVLEQLYFDGIFAEEEFKEFLKELVHSEEELGDFIYSNFAETICNCHFVDMLPEIYMLYIGDFIEGIFTGDYVRCVDKMFSYQTKINRCRSPFDARKALKKWLNYENEEIDDMDEEEPDTYEEMNSFFANATKKWEPAQKKVKIGRNDPCPCGSGKKYKQCCLNKPKTGLDKIESEEERKKVLKSYPETGAEKVPGRKYLDDYFDSESIEIDKRVYLALKPRYGFFVTVDEEAEEKRIQAYLKEAFRLFLEKVKKENIQTFLEYDNKYFIHYHSIEWIERLLEIGDEDIYDEVKEVYDKMSE